MTAVLEPIIVFLLGALAGLIAGLLFRWRDRVRARMRWPFGTASSKGPLPSGQFPVTCPRCRGQNDAEDRKEGEIQTCRICNRNFRVPPRHDPWHATAAAWGVMIVGVFAIIGPWWEAWEERTVQTKGTDAIARVVEKLPSRGRYQSDRVRVYFHTAQGARREAMKVDSYLFGKLRVGTHVSIRYLKGEPSRLIIHGTADDMPPQWYQFFLGFFAIGCASVIWCHKRDRTAKCANKIPMAWRSH